MRKIADMVLIFTLCCSFFVPAARVQIIIAKLRKIMYCTR